jgi:hypothetical protein
VIVRDADETFEVDEATEQILDAIVQCDGGRRGSLSTRFFRICATTNEPAASDRRQPARGRNRFGSRTIGSANRLYSITLMRCRGARIKATASK